MQSSENWNVQPAICLSSGLRYTNLRGIYSKQLAKRKKQVSFLNKKVLCQMSILKPEFLWKIFYRLYRIARGGSFCQNTPGRASGGGKANWTKSSFCSIKGRASRGRGVFWGYFDKVSFPLLSHFLRLRGELLFVNLIVSWYCFTQPMLRRASGPAWPFWSSAFR